MKSSERHSWIFSWIAFLPHLTYLLKGHPFSLQKNIEKPYVTVKCLAYHIHNKIHWYSVQNYGKSIIVQAMERKYYWVICNLTYGDKGIRDMKMSSVVSCIYLPWRRGSVASLPEFILFSVLSAPHCIPHSFLPSSCAGYSATKETRLFCVASPWYHIFHSHPP